jgi:hypothetical protein
MTISTPRSPDDVVAGLIADTSPYLSCDECFERLDEYVDALALDPQHADPSMGAHLRGCSACQEEAEALLELVVRDAAG